MQLNDAQINISLNQEFIPYFFLADNNNSQNLSTNNIINGGKNGATSKEHNLNSSVGGSKNSKSQSITNLSSPSSPTAINVSSPSAFLGCVRLLSAAIDRLKDTGTGDYLICIQSISHKIMISHHILWCN